MNELVEVYKRMGFDPKEAQKKAQKSIDEATKNELELQSLKWRHKLFLVLWFDDCLTIQKNKRSLFVDMFLLRFTKIIYYLFECVVKLPKFVDFSLVLIYHHFVIK